jgi:acetylornithine deacetylase/succinyl-diaminopimelate desuccinylase-like protein
VWGRGASDMKYSIASMMEVLLSWRQTGVRPRRDIVFTFLADEEADAVFGSEWLVNERAEWFADVAAAVGEGGGAPVDCVRPDRGPVRIYPVSTGERGIQHLRVTATGVSGHGSTANGDNPVVHLVDALSRLAHHAWPWQPSEASVTFLRGVSNVMGTEVDLGSSAGIAAAIEALSDELRSHVSSAARCSANPTVLRAGYKVNVIPGQAVAEIDVRTVPGREQECLRVIDELLGDHVTREFITDQPGISAPVDSPWFKAIESVLRRRDPEAVVVPFSLGGGTDAKAFARLGIQCYGFAPLGSNPDGVMSGGDHGVDEKVAIVSLVEGTSVLEEFLRTL